MDKRTCFDIPKDGLPLDNILDYCFNSSTQRFLLSAGLTSTMNVLELGCGHGVMSCWIANQIGADGRLIAIDNSPVQITRANALAEKTRLNNCQFLCQEVNEIDQIDQEFDFVYCRFILHHLESPRDVISKMLSVLKPGGIIAIEEGIVNNAFAYPYNESFGNERFTLLDHHANNEGRARDGNFGIKLYHTLFKAHVSQLSMNLVAPMLVSRDEKVLLLDNLTLSKRFQLDSGMTEEQWQHQFEQMQQMIEDDSAVVSFYQSAQVSGIK